MQRWRVLVIAAVATLAVIAVAVIVGVVGTSMREGPEKRNYLAGSTDACVTCHLRATPGIVRQFGRSKMAGAKVTCRSCHEVERSYPGAVEHEGTYVLRSPTPARCQRCHQQEVAQFARSRHALPAYVAYAGVEALDEGHLREYRAIPEILPVNQERNALFAIEGPEVTRFACRVCHDVGRPRQDGSVGHCEKCHLRHEFSLAQSRKPETCNQCHIGPDHPQWEIYVESPHGIMYHTQGDRWRWDAKPGTLTVADFEAPTCAICHFSGFAGGSTTHDVGERLSWFLFSPVSTRRPAWEDNRGRMQTVCFSCHNKKFVQAFYEDADAATEKVNAWVREGQALMTPLRERGLLTPELFDEPIDFESFELWHHWGRTAKFGAWMQGPDYTQWHGAYEVVKSLREVKAMADEKLQEAGK